MDSGSNATSAALACPAGSPLLMFWAALVQNISTQTEAERSRREQEGNGALAEYDYVVVGGGSAGCVLASRLSEDGSSSVLLLERGGHEPQETRVPAYTFNNVNSAIAEVFNAEAEPQNCNGIGCLLTVPRVLGGGSTLNAMLYVRGSRQDYDEWARLTGDRGWSYDAVLPYFRKSEDNLDPPINQDTKYHGRGGPQKVSWQPYRHPVIPLFEQALNASGVPARLDINAEGQLGYGVIQTTTAQGERWTTYRGFVEPVLGRSNLRVETFATARRVVLKRKASGCPRAVGVEYEDAQGKIHVVRARREVVLTAGAIHTPQLLMLSGIGPASQLQALRIPLVKDLPVGEMFLDHPDIFGVPYKCEPPLCVTDWQSRLADLRQYTYNRTGPLSALNIGHLVAFTRSSLADPVSVEQPDTQTFFLGNTIDEYVTCLLSDLWRLNRVIPIVSLMRPNSHGLLRLNSSNPHDHPVVKFNYFSDGDGHDLAVVVEGLRKILQLNETLAPLGLTLDTTNYEDCEAEGAVGSDAFLRCVARTRTVTSWHWAGSCPMGQARDPTAVLDSSLRVRGVRRLRVADASAIPYLPSGNINAAVIMLAERAADLVRRDHSLCPNVKNRGVIG